jgi:hypothetical protein
MRAFLPLVLKDKSKLFFYNTPTPLVFRHAPVLPTLAADR